MAIFGAVSSVHIVDPYNISCNYSGFVFAVEVKAPYGTEKSAKEEEKVWFFNFYRIYLETKSHSFPFL